MIIAEPDDHRMGSREISTTVRHAQVYKLMYATPRSVQILDWGQESMGINGRAHMELLRLCLWCTAERACSVRATWCLAGSSIYAPVTGTLKSEL